MDRSCASEPDHSTAMRTAGSAAFELLLSAAAGERSKSGSAPPTRSVVFEAPLLRQPQDGCRAGSEPKGIQRLMRILGIEAHYRKPNLSRPAPGHQVIRTCC